MECTTGRTVIVLSVISIGPYEPGAIILPLWMTFMVTLCRSLSLAVLASNTLARAFRRTLICRVVTKLGNKPNSIIGDFVDYLLARHQSRILAIHIMRR